MDTGLDRLATERDIAKKVRGGRVALLAHPASVTRDLVHAVDVLVGIGAKPRVIFGPEHGYGGEAQDMIGVTDARDIRGIPVKSLYGESYDALIPTDDALSEIDTLVVDLQDVGARYYTFVWTAVLAMRACARLKKRVLVLDRPNPVGCATSSVEGRMQGPAFLSFVGLVPIPIRHALTLGDLVAWRAVEEGLSAGQVEVVAVRGIDRTEHAPAWDRPFIFTSPNMPSYRTAMVYAGGCLLEGTNLSEGRGTTRPFEILGAPWIDGAKLAHDFHELGLAGVRVRPITFRPTFHKHAGETCGGVQVHVMDPLFFRPVRSYVALIALAHRQNEERFRFRRERYEFVDDIPAFDLLTGNREARALIATGAPPMQVASAVSEVDESDLRAVRSAREAGEESSV